jgi:hypothetical protein
MANFTKSQILKAAGVAALFPSFMAINTGWKSGLVQNGSVSTWLFYAGCIFLIAGIGMIVLAKKWSKNDAC